MLDKSIKELIKKNKKSYKQVLSMIKKYDKIVIFRHEMPDYDALGTQMGLATWLKENFKEKEIHVTGQNHVCFTPRLYPYMEEMEDAWFDNNEFLAIVVDTGNTARISDKRYQKAKNIIKIDHHPNKEPYGDIVIVNDELASCAELVANMLVYFNKKLSKEAAHYFYSGIAGDSGRFLYNSTSTHTFAIAQILIETGFNLSKDVYQKMYQKNIDDLKVTAYVLNDFKVSKGGVAYYVLPSDIQEKLKITTERGKENVNLFANIEGINAWCSITEDPKEGLWRVSIRSKETPINGVAQMFEGGGHDQASGCKLHDIKDLPKLIAELDKLFIK
mgnify:FL=1